MKEIAIELLQLAATIGAVIVTRWLLELSSPKEDWTTIKHWFYETFKPEKVKYYKFPEVTHQIRAWIILNMPEKENNNNGNRTTRESTGNTEGKPGVEG